MTDRSPAARRAQILHAAILVGTFVGGVMVSVVKAMGTVPAAVPPAMQWSVVPLALGLLVGRAVFRPVWHGDADLDTWWGRNMARALIVWSVAEAGFLYGAVLWLVTGQPMPLLLSLGAVLMLLSDRPSRLVHGA